MKPEELAHLARRAPGEAELAAWHRHSSGGLSRLERQHLLQTIRLQRGGRPRILIYDFAFHFMGGAQKYILTLAEAWQKEAEITLLANKPVSRQDLSDWYHLDLSGCALKICPLPFFDARDPVHIDPARVPARGENPFLPVARESLGYDLLVNNPMLEHLPPLSPLSLMICHFPERRPVTHFFPPLYTEIWANSAYTAHHMEQRWGLNPHRLLAPPADLPTEPPLPPNRKRRLVLSVARFETGGTKKQKEMLRAWARLLDSAPTMRGQWSLVLAGGSTPDNPYLDELHDLIPRLGLGSGDVEIRPNVPYPELVTLYREASLFWHLCGLHQDDPAKVEHFGMTIVEAMSHGVVPLVFNGGGQAEIVRHGVDGYTVSNTTRLQAHTLNLMTQEGHRAALSEQALIRGRSYGKDRFQREGNAYLSALTNRLLSVESEA